MTDDINTCPVCDGPLDADRDAICRVCCPHDGGLSDEEVQRMETLAQVDALRAKAEGMGLEFNPRWQGNPVITISPGCFLVFDEGSLATAATLLGALDPDAVVAHPATHTTLKRGSKCKGTICVTDKMIGPCDDDHEWVLVKRRKRDG